MGNRKLPFGYQMRMGEIIRNEPETKAVQDIFLQYTFGASLKEIAEQMSKTGPTYDVEQEHGFQNLGECQVHRHRRLSKVDRYRIV